MCFVLDGFRIRQEQVSGEYIFSFNTKNVSKWLHSFCYCFICVTIIEHVFLCVYKWLKNLCKTAVFFKISNVLLRFYLKIVKWDEIFIIFKFIIIMFFSDSPNERDKILV